MFISVIGRFRWVQRTSLIMAIAALLSFGGSLFDRPVSALEGINERINFQGRLLNSQGATVPDGYYNVQFRIYQDGTGTAAGNPGGSLEWTESWLRSAGDGVLVRNGYFSVELGSVNPFASQVDWNQDTLYLSINIGDTNASCTPFTSCNGDGEMLPMKRLSSTPYALNAGKLGGRSADQFIQSTTTLQSGNIAVQSANAADSAAVIQGAASQTADIFQIRADGVASALMSVAANGATTLQPASDSATTLLVNDSSGTAVLSVDTVNNRVGIGTTSPVSKLHVAGLTSAQGLNVCRYSDCSSTDILTIVASDNTSTITAGGGNTDGLVLNAASSTGDIRLHTQGALGFILDQDNRAGIGTTDTTGRLTVSNGSEALDILALKDDATDVLTVADGGATTLRNSTDSSSAFLIQNATGVAQLTADTSNSRIQIGSSTTDATAIVFALDNYNQATDPAGVDGAMYYNTDTNKFRCYENGSWTDCIGAGAGTFADRDLSNLTATSINQSLIANADNTLDLGSAAIGWRSGYFGTAVYSPLFDTASAGALSIGTTNATSVAIGQSSITTTLSSDTINVGSATADTTVQKTAQTTADTAGAGLKIQGATGNGTGAGGVVTIQGGTGGATNANGGNVVLSGGTGTGTGVDGLVVVKTAAFSTTVNDANCYTGGALVASSCTISLDSVNTSTGIIAGVSTDGSTVTLPDPTLLTAGRIIYITAANGSKDFKLIVNGGGIGNEIAMRQNSSATMLWNGSDWTAAGASSSTTLQNAYDNTLQSAGGAELVVSKTASTNGFTIRDSSTNPVDGRLLVVQTSSAADLISINSNVTEYASNAGAENTGATTVTFPANTWSAITGATVGRYATTGSFIATGEGSVSVQTGTSTGSGVANQLTTALTAGTAYNVSLTTRLASGTFTDLQVQYSPDGTSSSPVACASDKVVNSSVWTKINCTFTAPASGITSSNAIFISQSNAGPARTFYVDNLSVTIAADYNYATDGSVNNALGTNWTSVGGTTISRVTTVGYDAGDSVSVTTTGANQGVRNKLSIDPLPDTLYRVNVYANIASGTFDSFNVSYSRDGTGVSPVQCADYNTQTVTAGSAFTKISCYIQTDGTTATDPHVYFTQTDATGRTFYVDRFSMTLSTVTTPNVQIGGGSNGGPTTLFTLDRGASAPIASDNDALLGSMYYDTTLGKLQCYEADGWGACGSSPDNIITISPEYTNAVLNGTGIGTMTSDLCSDTLDINDGSVGQLDVCGTNETYNFYRWTSPQASAQTYSIYVTYQLPGTFKDFEPSTTSLMGRTDSTNSTVNYQIYRNTSSGLTACGSTVAVSTGAASSWQVGNATGASDPSACGFTAGDSVVFKINTTASSNASAYVGNLNFTFSNR